MKWLRYLPSRAGGHSDTLYCRNWRPTLRPRRDPACRWFGRSSWLPNCSGGRMVSVSRLASPSNCSPCRVCSPIRCRSLRWSLPLKPPWCSRLKSGYRGGGIVQLDVEIDRKAFTNAAGERHDVLSDFAFRLGAGEVGVFVGPSGCGKSTMLRIIAGLDPDYQGRISRPAGARIGMVFQEPRLLPWRSVEDNVRLAAPLADETKLSALFAILELNAHRSHFPGELSLGLARRVALARAFAVDPDFLILDEPLASLDDALAARLRDQIAVLVDSRPVMTLLVTHNVDDAVRLGDRLFLLSPRPARILADLTIRTPRSARGEAEIAAIKADIARRTNGDRIERDAS